MAKITIEYDLDQTTEPNIEEIMAIVRKTVVAVIEDGRKEGFWKPEAPTGPPQFDPTRPGGPCGCPACKDLLRRMN